MLARALRLSFVFVASGVSVAMAACQSSPSAQVVAADGVLCDLTRRLAAAALSVECLLQPGDDPHQFRLTPSHGRALRQASLVLINGYGLTPALAAHPHSVAVAERAVPESPRLEADHDADPSSEHRHGDRDPHVWHDPSQAAAMVRLVAGQLQQRQPSARAAIAARAEAMTDVLARLDRWNRRQFATIPGTRPLATSHRAFASLARAYDLREWPVVDAMSSSDSLRPQAFLSVVRDLKREQVPMLFPEQLPASKALLRIHALSGVPLAPAALVADGLAPSSDGTVDLVSTLTANTCLIVQGLNGRCDRQGQEALIRQWRQIR